MHLAGTRREQQLTLDLLEALGSSLDLGVVLAAACPLLMRLVPADCAALGVSRSARPEDFEWTVADLPAAFFASYPEMAPHDFVRRAVSERPNLVLDDRQMVSRSDLERNVMYQRAREVGAPLEHVLAVLLHAGGGGQSGFSLYRAKKKPFSSTERARLQQVTPALANTVRNCQAFGVRADWKAALERLLDTPSSALLLVTDSGTEVARSDALSALFARWFAPFELHGARLPDALLGALQQARVEGSAVWRRKGLQGSLEVRIQPLSVHFGVARWLVHCTEQPATGLPDAWLRLLSRRQQQVAGAVLRGWDNRLIAAELGCAEATVKKHLQAIFDKLGLASRQALIARTLAAERGQKTS